MAFSKNLREDKVLPGCCITFIRFYYDQSQRFEVGIKSGAWAKMKVEIKKISEKGNYSCFVKNVINRKISGSLKVNSEGDQFVISGRNLFKTASFHDQGKESITKFGEVYSFGRPFDN